MAKNTLKCPVFMKKSEGIKWQLICKRCNRFAYFGRYGNARVAQKQSIHLKENAVYQLGSHSY